MSKLIETIEYSPSHYKIVYTGEANGSTYQEADQLFMDKVSSFVLQGWFVEIVSSDRYHGVEAHAWRHNLYTTNIVDMVKK